jgi:8-oxo-dGTP pyrophosphatase MutT (NUDIX family)
MKKNFILKAAGALFYATSTKRFLFLLRSGDSYNHTWGLPGGKAQGRESIKACLHRELHEEISWIPPVSKIIPLDLYTSADHKFEYHTFVYVVEDEFIPKLNDEHAGWAWTVLEGIPKPLHPGLFSSFSIDELKNKLAAIQDIYSRPTTTSITPVAPSKC